MNKEIIIETFREIFGTKATLKSKDKTQAVKNIPVLVAQSLEFYELEILKLGWKVTLAEFKSVPDVRLADNYYKQILKNIKGNFAYIFSDINTRQRQSFIARQIQFIIPKKFIFIPSLGVSSSIKTNKSLVEQIWDRETLSLVAESILIKRLLDENFEGACCKDFSEALQVQGILITKAVIELEERGIISINKRGKEKLIFFGKTGELWANVNKILTNPVVGSFYVAKSKLNLPLAGETALSKSSMLEDLSVKTYAIYKRDIKKFDKPKTEGIIGEVKVEVWKRNPKIFSNNGTVDGVSLFLSLRDHNDERVQIALNEHLRNLRLIDG